MDKNKKKWYNKKSKKAPYKAINKGFSMIIYFDTETTSLSPGGIIQLAYIMQEGENITAKNFYFYTPQYLVIKK